MTEHKYIRHSKIGFIVFPDMTNLFHMHVANMVTAKEGGKIISAGFLRFYSNPAEVICYGMSESLGVRAAKEDSELATKQFFGSD